MQTIVDQPKFPVLQLNEDEEFISILPLYTPPEKLFYSEKLPCHAEKITYQPIEMILQKLNRQKWLEGLFVKKNDFPKIYRYRNRDGSYKNDFDDIQFAVWLQNIENNTAICELEIPSVGKGVFVVPGKKLPKGTFIPSSGIVKLDPTIEEYETKVHCSALINLNTNKREIYGLIDPERIGGLLDYINHAPTYTELLNFDFKDNDLITSVAISNLKSTIKFYKGYAIMGVEVPEDIEGGKYGKQLLWSYAHPFEYENDHQLYLFSSDTGHNGELLNPSLYQLKMINIFVDAGDLILRKVASLTRWELTESDPDTTLIVAAEDPFSQAQSEAIQSPIPYSLLQRHLKKNPQADRIVINLKM